MFAFVLTGKNISNGEVNIRLHVFDRIWLKCNFHLYRLLLQQLPLVGIFEGDPHCLYFSHNIGMLEKGIYKLAGQAIAWSLLHDGPGFPAFHPYLFDMMCGVRGNNSIKITDIRDEEALRNIQMVITSWATRFIYFWYCWCVCWWEVHTQYICHYVPEYQWFGTVRSMYCCVIVH